MKCSAAHAAARTRLATRQHGDADFCAAAPPADFLAPVAVAPRSPERPNASAQREEEEPEMSWTTEA